MKDALLLLVTGAACSLAAWAFWHYLGNDAFGVLNTLFLVAAVVDNFRLRRQLRAHRG
jgi:hypothetical protein